MPEGDTIHRAARRINLALGGREIARAEAPNPRSPIHLRASELQGHTLRRAEARGKHLLIHFSGELVIHSHLGMNGRWRIEAGANSLASPPWLLLAGGDRFAAQTGGKLLRLVGESRARNDPLLLRLGPDPLGPAFDRAETAARLRSMGVGRKLGEALLDQEVVAGIGNAISNGACFAAGISPWRPVGELTAEEAERLIAEAERIMRVAIESGRRPPSIYRAERRGCPRCGGKVEVRGQGEANRATYWCPRCQS